MWVIHKGLKSYPIYIWWLFHKPRKKGSLSNNQDFIIESAHLGWKKNRGAEWFRSKWLKQFEVEKNTTPRSSWLPWCCFGDWMMGFWMEKPIFFGQTLDHLGKGHLWLDSWLAASKWIFCDFIFQGYTLSMICFICILTRHLSLWYGGYKKRSRSYSHHLPWSSNNVRVTLKLKYWAMKSSSFLVAGPFLGEKRLYTWIC